MNDKVQSNNSSSSRTATEPPWYRDVTTYQWLVLVLASAGWVFDIYEGQIFNITRRRLLADLLQVSTDHPDVRFHGETLQGVFLVGGAVGGVLFGGLADRWGRRPVLILTIFTYSLFSGLTYFVENLWQLAVLRFLVALGTGGEWSVAAALVAEVFPARGRAQAGSIFHASSIFGTWLAGLAGMLVGTEWRQAYLLGVLPALLVLAVRTWIDEPAPSREVVVPESEALRDGGRIREGEAPAEPDDPGRVARQEPRPPEVPRPPGAANTGGFQELWTNLLWRKRAILGLLLAAVGLGTFWGVTVAGQDLAQNLLKRNGWSENQAEAEAKFAYGIVQATGGGLGLLAFGPLAMRWGRKRTFLFMQVMALVIVPVTCFLPTTYWQLLLLLPAYGFFTLGMHAGFAIYFPELFPARLRALAAGLCFNGGRLAAAWMLLFSGWLKSQPGISLPVAVTLMSLLFLGGIVLLRFLPETRGQPLPD